MSSPSNLYAEKIYAEQPIALWSLDDDCTFASFISNTGLSLATWTKSSGTLSAELPNSQDPYAKILDSSFVSVTSTSAGTVTLTSTETVSTSSNFSAGLWVNPQSGITSVSITIGSLNKTFSLSSVTDTWVYLGNVFEVSTPISAQSVQIKIVNTGSSGTPALVYLNGFSIGKNQEFFGTRSTGSHLTSFDYGIGVEAFQYGIGDNVGWYLGNSTTKELYSKNFSVPLVYGANTSTVLYENPDGPSLMIPGMGFLNESGSKQNISFEAWLRINVDGNVQDNPFRILGPIASSDGVYVYGQHLILKVGDNIASHYVGEWFRPMLLNLEYTVGQVRMFINGEMVCSVEFDSVSFPDQFDGATSQDFIGFYVGDNISFIEIDCVAYYPYKLTPVILKRRFGYGQAVSLPSEIETAYSGKQIAIDYTFAGYSADYGYPKIESWSSSSKDSVYTNRSTMGSPKFIKPDVVLSDQDVTEKQWLDQVVAVNVADTGETKPFISITPGTLSSKTGYLYYKSIAQQYMGKPVAFYMTGKKNDSASDVDQVLFKIQNRETLDSITAILSGDTIEYVYNVFGKQGTISTQSVNVDGTFVAGIDVSTYNAYSSSKTPLRRFLNGLSRYSLFVGGDYTGADQDIKTTFTGKIYSFGALSKLDYAATSASSLFLNGIAKPLSFTTFYALKPTYCVSLFKQTFGSDNFYRLNVSAKSYWQDYIPLSKFAKTANYQDGTSKYLTDMIQISIDTEYSRLLSSGKINQNNVDVRTYVHFIKASEINQATLTGSGFTAVPLDDSKVVDAKTEWASKKFEVVDGTVVYVPQSGFASGTDQTDYVMVTSMTIYTRSVDLLPVKIRALEYASQTFNRYATDGFDQSVAKKIGTRTQASNVYMFSETAGHFDYSAYNPIAISKTMSPYLYMTDKSGIKVLDSYSTGNDRGIFIPINKDAVSEYYVSILSMSMLFNDAVIPAEMTIAEVYDDEYGKLRIVLEASTNDPTKGSLSIKKLVDTTWTKLDNIEFYVNGTYVVSPELVRGEWSTVGILFVTNPINASSLSTYKIEIIGSVVINNIAYFQKRQEELGQQILPNEWNDYDSEAHWADFDTEAFWSNIYASENEVRPSLTPNIIFDVYSGTNKIIAIESDDISGVSLENFSYDIINNVSLDKTATVSP